MPVMIINMLERLLQHLIQLCENIQTLGNKIVRLTTLNINQLSPIFVGRNWNLPNSLNTKGAPLG